MTVVIPARDEATRIGPAIESVLRHATTPVRVVVVDDGSSDGTADVARNSGADVIAAGPLPSGWAGKAHALQVGIEAAATDVVLTLDADVRVAPGFVDAAVASHRQSGAVLTAWAAAVHNPSRAGRAVHAALLATLLVRFGPPGVDTRSARRVLSSGQCTTLDRTAFLDHGGFTPVRGNLVEDVAIARHLHRLGRPVRFEDATPLLTVEGYGGAAATLAGWGRSIALADVSNTTDRVIDAITIATLASPIPRLLAGRGDGLDLATLALRSGVVAATAPAFRPGGPELLTAPLLDPLVAARFVWGAVRPSRTWRGRTYAPRGASGNTRRSIT